MRGASAELPPWFVEFLIILVIVIKSRQGIFYARRGSCPTETTTKCPTPKHVGCRGQKLQACFRTLALGSSTFFLCQPVSW